MIFTYSFVVGSTYAYGALSNADTTASNLLSYVPSALSKYKLTFSMSSFASLTCSSVQSFGSKAETLDEDEDEDEEFLMLQRH